MEYINSDQVSENYRQMAAIQVKNLIKKIYGAHSYTHYDEKKKEAQGELLPEDDPANLIDDQGRQVLQAQLVEMLMKFTTSGCDKLTSLILEIIGLMGRRYVQVEWPSLFPSLIAQLTGSQDPKIYKTVFECVKKITKKYRYMFRSDELYTEMNYVIENLSQHMINSLRQCVEMAGSEAAQADEGIIRVLYSVMNSVLHIIESVLSQEELPDFYEEQLPTITMVCNFVLQQNYPKLAKVPQEIIKAQGKVVSLI